MSLSPLETKRFTFTESSSQPISGYVITEHSIQIAASLRDEGRNEAGEILESIGVIPDTRLLSHSEFLVDVLYEDRLNTGIAPVPDSVEEIESGEVVAVLYDDPGNRVGDAPISVSITRNLFLIFFQIWRNRFADIC